LTSQDFAVSVFSSRRGRLPFAEMGLGIARVGYVDDPAAIPERTDWFFDYGGSGACQNTKVV